MELFEELQARGFIDKITSEELPEKINNGGITFYMGFDPTGDSLHVGHLAAFCFMRKLQRGGHNPVGVMGGATGMIGDPGGKNAERNLQTIEQIRKNIEGIKGQAERFLDFEAGSKATLVNNYDWLSGWSFIDFLRDIGKNFSVNQMVQRESVKMRLEREGAGISYTEFSYMLLQSYDFYHLNKELNVTMQIGGSDQWGNIVSGIDLTRRLSGNQVYGITMPLITKSDGTKFGKSEKGAVFLSPLKTSPYEFYQYFMNQSDEDVIRFLKIFTDLTLDEVAELEQQTKEAPHLRTAQKTLAEEITRMVHGDEVVEGVIRASKVLFGEKIENLDDATISQIFKDVPSTAKNFSDLGIEWTLVDALVETGASKSKGQARKLIQSGGVYLNNTREENVDLVITKDQLASASYMIIRTGKKNYRLVSFS